MSSGTLPRLITYDTSICNLSGGIISTIDSYGDSEINLSGQVEVSDLNASNSSSINSVSADITIGNVILYGSSTVNILDGTITGSFYSFWDKGVGNATINISGGTMDRLDLHGSSIANISGGIINSISVGRASDRGSLFNIIGYNLVSNPY